MIIEAFKFCKYKGTAFSAACHRKMNFFKSHLIVLNTKNNGQNRLEIEGFFHVYNLPIGRRATTYK